MVAPLQVNCTAIRDGVLGPSVKSNLALKEPKMSISTKISIFPRCCLLVNILGAQGARAGGGGGGLPYRSDGVIIIQFMA